MRRIRQPVRFENGFPLVSLIERLVRPVMVGLMLMAFKFQIECADIQVAAVNRVELIATGAIGAFHATDQFGRFGQQHVRRNAKSRAVGNRQENRVRQAVTRRKVSNPDCCSASSTQTQCSTLHISLSCCFKRIAFRSLLFQYWNAASGQ